MYVVSAFEHSLKLELALTRLENGVVPRSNILAVPLAKKKEWERFADLYNEDGLNLFPVSCIAAVCMLLGTIYGFVLYWGPVLWGLIGLVVGIALGLLLERILRKRRIAARRAHPIDVVLLVNCNGDPATIEKVERILLEHDAIGVSSL
ncbi:hypothetical protein MO973_26445 [Paenibacillus sp. TRM 82003]|nr:hypothetical protein [Paenibacillus sp. TRM 82003]